MIHVAWLTVSHPIRGRFPAGSTGTSLPHRLQAVDGAGHFILGPCVQTPVYRRLATIFSPDERPGPTPPSRAEPGNTAIAWLTHFHDPEGQGAFRRLAAEAGEWGHVLQFCDGTALGDHQPAPDAIVLRQHHFAAALPRRYRRWQEWLRSTPPPDRDLELLADLKAHIFA